MIINDKLKDYLLSKAITASQLPSDHDYIKDLNLDSISVIEVNRNPPGKISFTVIVDTLGMIIVPFDGREFSEGNSFWCL